jgi:pimeloyl-ACP methyl ester carboxylesterase
MRCMRSAAFMLPLILLLIVCLGGCKDQGALLQNQDVFVALALIAVLVIARVLLPAGTPRIHLTRGSDPTKAIAVLEKIRIGGSDQWILERSENVDNPIILFLHGGPGTSELTLNRRITKDLEKSFIVVNWDQRGAGKSYRAISDAAKMNIDQFVADTKELTLYLLKKFHKDRIVLAGHSWGSVIGALTASRYPELFYCYIGIGQVAQMEENERASYQWTLQQAVEKNDKRAIAKLEKIGPPPYQGDWQSKFITQRMLLGRFGGEVHASRNGALGLVMGSVLFSREYSFGDRINFFKGILGSLKLLGPQLITVDLFKTVPEFKIPVYMMEGRYDHEVPSEIAQRYFDALKAPSKELIWFEESAHMVKSEEKDKFNGILLDHIRPRLEDPPAQV